MDVPSASLDITLDPVWTDYPVVNVRVQVDGEVVEVMAELDPATTGRHLVVYGVHVQSSAAEANVFGWVRMRRLAMAFMEAFDVDSIRASGAIRTTGAKPGRRPRPLRFERMVADRG